MGQPKSELTTNQCSNQAQEIVKKLNPDDVARFGATVAFLKEVDKLKPDQRLCIAQDIQQHPAILPGLIIQIDSGSRHSSTLEVEAIGKGDIPNRQITYKWKMDNSSEQLGYYNTGARWFHETKKPDGSRKRIEYSNSGSIIHNEKWDQDGKLVHGKKPQALF